ncbi:MAG: MucB/RseB C-terminal domain-containing protein [Gammaproteobacteria bacterium]
MTDMNKCRPGFTCQVVSFLLCLPLSITVSAESGAARAQELINKMTQAARSRNYEGVFIYRYGNSMDTMRIIHKADNGGERQRLVSLTGSAREVIRNNESVTCIFPDDRAVLVEKSRSRKLVFKLPQPIESVSRYYTFSTSGQDRIAGRDSWTVNIMPRDQYRYGYRFWIDQDSHLLLKSELRDQDDSMLEQILFTQLDIHDDIPDTMLEPALTGKDYTWYKSDVNDKPSKPGNKGWRVTWVPDGFSMKTHQSQTMPMSREPVEHIIYTDGIAVVSVFIEKMDHDVSETIGSINRGGISTFTRHENGFQITAVGEVPRTTVEKMARSVLADNY